MSTTLLLTIFALDIKFAFELKQKIMIQRKQTVYLIIVMLLMASTFLIPSAKGVISSNSGDYHNIYQIMPHGVYGTSSESIEEPSLFSTIYMTVSIIFVIFWTGLIISKFKNRWLQIRLTVFLIIWLICIEVLMVVYGYKLIGELDKLSDVQNGFPLSWGALMPIVSIILAYLAFRGILKDELLIKSLNSNRMRG